MRDAAFTVAVVLGLITLFGAVVADACMVEVVSRETATVVATSYTPASFSTGIGQTSNGDAVPVFTSTPAKWAVVLKLARGDVITHNARDMSWWASLKPDSPVRVARCRSGIFGRTWLWPIER